MQEYSKAFEESLELELQRCQALREKFQKKLSEIPEGALEKYGPEQMHYLSMNGTKNAYILAAQVLGFPIYLNQPFHIQGEKKRRSVFKMALDYVSLLYNFSKGYANTINEVTKKKLDFEPYYDYFKMLSQ